MNSRLPFGIDISRWNYSQDGTKKMDFYEVATHVNPRVDFIAIRSNISWGYTDPWFSYGWYHAERVSLPRMAYVVPYFGENALRQADSWFRTITPADWNHDRIVLDNEVAHDNSPGKITETTIDLLNICRSRTGRYPMIYSRATWVNPHMIVSWLPKGIDWWLAQYLWPRPYPLYTPEHPGPPDLPVGVSDWLIHQTAERGKSIGTKAMHYMDYNRWNTANQTIDQYFNLVQKPQIYKLTLRGNLWVRPGPGVEYNQPGMPIVVRGMVFYTDVKQAGDTKLGDWYFINEYGGWIPTWQGAMIEVEEVNSIPDEPSDAVG